MEFVTIKPIENKSYNTNILHSRLIFEAFNKPSPISIKNENNQTMIIVKRGNLNVKFNLKKPFDYPNNFDFFKLVCVDTYEDMSSIDDFLLEINNFIKKSIVNLSFGFILEYMVSKINTISDNLKALKINKVNTKVENKISESLTLNKEEINIQSETNDNSKLILNNLYSYYNSLVNINYKDIYLHLLKNKFTPSDINKKFSFEKIFVFIKNFINYFYKNPPYDEIFLGNNLFDFRIVKNNYIFNVKIDPLNYIVNISPISPVLTTNPLEYFGTEKTCEELIENYIKKTKNLNHVKDNKYNTNIFNIMKYYYLTKSDSNLKELKHNIKMYIDNILKKNTLKRNTELLLNIFKNHGWNNGMNSKTYIMKTVSELKIAYYLPNKIYYDILINIIIFNFNEFKDSLDLDNLQKQYIYYLNIRKERFECFDNLFKLYHNN